MNKDSTPDITPSEGLGCILAAIAAAIVIWALSGFPGLS
jgi:hypothetical protein